MRRSVSAAIPAVAVLLVLAQPFCQPFVSTAGADDASAVTSLQRAQEVARAALAAHGDRAAIAGIRAIEFVVSGPSCNALQARVPAHFEGHDSDGSFRARNRFDFARDRYAQEYWQELPGGFSLHFGTIAAPDTVTNLTFFEGTYNRQIGPAARGGAAGLVDVASRFLPPLVLRRMLDAPGSLRWIAEVPGPAGPGDLIEFSWDATTRYRMLVDRGDHRVLEVRALQPDPVLGNDEARIAFRGEQRVGGIVFPESVRVHRRGGQVLALAVSDLALPPAIQSDAFAPPGNLREIPLREFETVALGGGLHEVRGIGAGSYRAQFLVLADQVVAFDPLLNPGVTGRLLGEIRKVAGVLPVRVVVVSHFHADHAGGLTAALRAGATALVPAGSEAPLRRYAAAAPSVANLAPPPPPPANIEVVPAERIVRDSTGRTCRVLALGVLPHVEGMLALYDDSTRTLVAADVYSRAMPFNEQFAAFAEWVERRGLKVERLVGTHHDPIAWTEFRALARDFRKRGRGRAAP